MILPRLKITLLAYIEYSTGTVQRLKENIINQNKKPQIAQLMKEYLWKGQFQMKSQKCFIHVIINSVGYAPNVIFVVW